MAKLFAALGILVGAAETLIQVAVAFGAHITPDQHTAIGSVAGLVLLILGLWFHPTTSAKLGLKG